jgi:hypothetical protein
LTVSGNVVYVNVQTLAVQDPIIALGRGANNAPLTVDDGKSRGVDMWYYDTQEKQAFIGWDDASGKLFAAANVGIANEVVSVSNYGTFVVGTLEAANISTTTNISTGNLTATGQISTTGNVVGANINAGAISISGNVISALAVTGNITGANVNTPGAVSATGNITGGNIVTTGSLGNISGANVVSAVTFTATGNITGGNLVTAALIQGATLSATGAVSLSTATDTIGIGTSQTTGTTTIGGTAQTGFIQLGRSTAAQGIFIGNGVTGTGNTKTISFGDIHTTLKIAEKIQNNKIAIKPILPPTVKIGEERIRICIHSFNILARTFPNFFRNLF